MTDFKISVSIPYLNQSFQMENLYRNIERNRYIALSLPELTKQLNVAASEGSYNEVSKLITNGASIHSYGPLGMNPLLLAAMNGHFKVCINLIKAGVVIDSRNKLGKTALHMSAINCHEQVVHLLLVSGASVDALDMLHMTPLHWACDRGHLGVAKILLHHKADPRLLSNFRKSPLDIAQEKKYFNIVKLIQNEKENQGVEECSFEAVEDLIDSSFEDSDYEDIDQNLDPTGGSRSDELPRSPHDEMTVNKNSEGVFSEDVDVNEIEDNVSLEENEVLDEETDQFSGTCQMDEESVAQDEMLKSLNKLEEITLLGQSTNRKLIDACTREVTAELLMAQSLVSLDDPSRMLRRAIYCGQTIQLTEAGQMALAMIRPDPLIIPDKNAKKDDKKKEEKEEPKNTNDTSECNAVVLRSNTLSDMVKELSSYGSIGLNNYGPPVKRYKR